MKKLFLIIVFSASIFCTAQTYPLRTYGIDFPKDSYQKDTNNELLPYEGTWKGTWDNKTIFIIFKRIKYYKSFLENEAYYADVLSGKFKILDVSGNILFNNISLADEEAKIRGSNFKKDENLYGLMYIDEDLCGTSGRIEIKFADSTNAKLIWKYMRHSNFISTDCPYYTTGIPDTSPKNIILTKQ